VSGLVESGSVRAEGRELAELGLEELMRIEITAAAKHPQREREAPSAVTVITREEIRDHGWRTLAEVLRSVPGFYTSSDRNYGYVGVRGFLRPGDFNSRILLLVNGHTYNDDIYQQAYVDPAFGIDLEAIERIEVVRGPGSALYGGNALFAVINVVTAGARERPGVEARVETGSFGRKRGQASLGHVFEGGTEAFATASILDLDGRERIVFRDLADEDGGVSRNADGERALAFFGSVRSGDFTLQGGANLREKEVPTGAYGTNLGDDGTRTRDARPFAELAYSSPTLFRGFETSGRVYYDGWSYHGTYVYGSGEERVRNEDFASSHWGGAELRVRRELFSANHLTIGTEGSYHPRAHQENYDVGGERYLHDDRSFGTYGVYAQDEWAPLEVLRLVGGVRFDRSYEGIEETSPRGAILWTPLERSTVKLLYGRAFRAPNVYEQYYASPGVGFLRAPSLDPERMTTYELVLEQRLPRGARLTASGYHYEIDDLIDQIAVDDPDGEGTGLQFRNLTSARASGGELELRLPLPGGIDGRASYSFQDARASGGRRLTNSPEHLGRAALTGPLGWGVRGGAELVVLGSRFTTARRSLGPVPLANVSFELPTGISDLEFTTGLYNLLDRRYADPGGAEHRQDRIPQDRFTWRLQLAYRF
jgi:outer membrane receptor for ferrienterochelin and colicins